MGQRPFEPVAGEGVPAPGEMQGSEGHGRVRVLVQAVEEGLGVVEPALRTRSSARRVVAMAVRPGVPWLNPPRDAGGVLRLGPPTGGGEDGAVMGAAQTRPSFDG